MWSPFPGSCVESSNDFTLPLALTLRQMQLNHVVPIPKELFQVLQWLYSAPSSHSPRDYNAGSKEWGWAKPAPPSAQSGGGGAGRAPADPSKRLKMQVGGAGVQEGVYRGCFRHWELCVLWCIARADGSVPGCGPRV